MPRIAALTANQTPAAALAGYLQLSQALAKSSLSAVEREYIALAEVAWMTLSNYVNNIAGTNIDFPPAVR